MFAIRTRTELLQSAVEKTGQISLEYGHRAVAYIPTRYLENHAASLAELSNGDILAVWFAGDVEEGKAGIRIVQSRLNRDSDRWTEPVEVSGDPVRSEQNPVLFEAPDGKLWLMYTAQDAQTMSREEYGKLHPGGAYTRQETAVIRLRISEDNGYTWGPVGVFSENPGSFCRTPIVVLDNGDWIFPMWYSLADGVTAYGSDYSVVRISTDKGQSWTEYPIPGSRGRVHASLIEDGGGKLTAFFRSRSADNIYVGYSEDYGRTWTEPVRTSLPNNNASIRAIRLKSGRIAMIYNHCRGGDDPAATLWPKERYPVTVALSEDGGVTWPYRRHVDAGDGFDGEANRGLNRKYEYPWILQDREGLLHAVYSFAGRVGIKHVLFTEDWVIGLRKEKEGRSL
ncbi:sialidase family protein [Cohnella zeiphila]|uniref:Exo-alpha-sialidase n=1 Tax=Cohnella zeiphila TaxID=2761120 RepID=A0A7X0VUR5_9BACL|nr:sialidase family protein [Cohnella zeiphila]MBB6730675.1 exo-alpha-sialidase [Cohnella zeiphila]